MSPHPSGLVYQSNVHQVTQPRSPSSHSGMTRAEVGCNIHKNQHFSGSFPKTTHPICTQLSIAQTPRYHIFLASPPSITLLLSSSSFPHLLSVNHKNIQCEHIQMVYLPQSQASNGGPIYSSSSVPADECGTLGVCGCGGGGGGL